MPREKEAYRDTLADILESGLKDATASDFWGCVMQFWNEQQQPNNSVKTGMSLLDAITGGFQRSGFYIIAGRSGKGKTDFSVTLATNISAKYRVSYMTMEMKKAQLIGIISSRVAQVNGAKIRDRTMTVEKNGRVLLAQGR